MISNIEQELTSRSQMRNNLASVQFNIMGLANKAVLHIPSPKQGQVFITGIAYSMVHAVVDYAAESILEANATIEVSGYLIINAMSHMQASATVNATGSFPTLYGEAHLDAMADLSINALSIAFGSSELSAEAIIEATRDTQFIVNNNNNIVNNGNVVVNTP